MLLPQSRLVTTLQVRGYAASSRRAGNRIATLRHNRIILQARSKQVAAFHRKNDDARGLHLLPVECFPFSIYPVRHNCVPGEYYNRVLRIPDRSLCFGSYALTDIDLPLVEPRLVPVLTQIARQLPNESSPTSPPPERRQSAARAGSSTGLHEQIELVSRPGRRRHLDAAATGRRQPELDHELAHRFHRLIGDR